MQKIRWGLIGASTIARQHMVNVINNQPGGQVVALVSRNAERARAFAQEFSIPQYFTTVEQMLAECDLDAVYISTTNDLHYAQTLLAASAKKHVLCEKPLAMSVAEAKTMVAACQKAGVVFGTNHHLRHADAHKKIHDLLHQGVIGTPLFARVFHATYLPDHLQTWRIDRPEAGGGVILDITVHDIDVLRFILGCEPVSAMAMAQSGTMTKNDLDDGMMGILRFENGMLAQINSAFTTKYAGNGLEIHGTQGSIIGRNIMSQRSIGEVFLRTEKGESAIPIQQENLYANIVALFHHAIRGEAEFHASGYDGLRSLEISLALAESCKTGQSIAIAR